MHPEFSNTNDKMVKLDTVDKGLVIDYGEGGGGLQNGRIAGPKLLVTPHQDRVKLVTPPFF